MRELLAVSLLLLFALSVNATPSLSVTGPALGTYTKAGQSATIAFTWSDSNSGITDASARIYYSSTPLSFTTPIADMNLKSDANCVLASGSCTYSWPVPSTADGNYYVDVNVHTWSAGTQYVNDTNIAASSPSFVIDGTKPAIAIRQPLDLNTQVSLRTVEFDVNDVIGVSLSTIRVDVNRAGTTFQSPYFSNASSGGNCVQFGASYYCTYLEYSLDTNGADYNVSVGASDFTGNAADKNVSRIRFLDSTAPTSVTGLTATAGTDGTSATLSWGNGVDYNSTYDLNNYNVYIDINKAITSASSAGGFLDKNYVTLAQQGTGTKTHTITGLARDKNYYFAVVAVDKSGNLNAAVTHGQNGARATTVDSNAPTFNLFRINGGAAYSSSVLVGLDLNAFTDANSANFACSSSGSAFQITRKRGYGNHYSDFNITDTNIGCQLNDGNINIYARVYDQNNNYSQMAASIVLDRTPPSAPTIDSVSQTSEGRIRLSWSASSDSLSGITKYKVYKASIANLSVANMTLVYTTDNNSVRDYNDYGSLSNNTKYYYAVTATNGAGLDSNGSAQASITYYSGCAISPVITVPAYVKAGKLTITASASGTMYNVQLKARKPGQTDYNVISSTSGAASVSGDFYVNLGEDGTVIVILNAIDSLTRVCDTSNQFSVDTISPSIVWSDPADGNTLTDITTLKASAIDSGNFPSGIKSVSFYYDGKYIADGNTQGTNAWQRDWNVFTAEDGNHSLKAIAADKAGNTAESTIAVILKKKEEGLLNATKALSMAKTSLASALDLANYLAASGIGIPSGALAFKQAADSNYLQAQADFSSKNYALAAVGALDASKNYDLAVQRMNAIRLSPERVSDYNYDANGLESLLAESLSKSVALEAQALIEASKVQRKMEILRVTSADNNFVYYRATIGITLRNATGKSQALRLREIVPKEFAQSSDDLYSSAPFTAIQKDPVLEWTIDLNDGQSASIYYGLKRNLTKEEADRLAAANVMEKYELPPIVVKAETTISRPASAKGFKWPVDPLIIAVIVIAVAAALAYLFVLRPKKYTFAHTGTPQEQVAYAAKDAARAVKKKVVPEPRLRK